MTRILICSPVRLYCEGLVMLLRTEADFELASTAGEGRSWIREAARMAPEVILVDLALPDSVEAVGALSDTIPGARVVALSVAEDEAAVVDCVKAGVRAFVSREASVDELRRTIVLAAQGESPAPSWLVPMLLRRVAADADGSSCTEASLERLTRREQQVLTLVADGLSNKQIARQLCIEVPTVKNHVHNILEKLEVSRRAEAVARLHQRGAVPTEIVA
jgi:DNA-binding NarL/FixJ family response regulator